MVNFPAAPFVDGSETSEAAAVAIEPSAGTDRALVLDFLRRNGPATDEEIQEGIFMNPSTERPRRIELYRGGLVVDTGRKGKTRAGRRATLWDAKP